MPLQGHPMKKLTKHMATPIAANANGHPVNPAFANSLISINYRSQGHRSVITIPKKHKNPTIPIQITIANGHPVSTDSTANIIFIILTL